MHIASRMNNTGIEVNKPKLFTWLHDEMQGKKKLV